MRESAALRLEPVTRRHDAMVAVDDVSFEVPPGTYVMLLGPSASGCRCAVFRKPRLPSASALP